MEYTPPEETNRRVRQREAEEREAAVRRRSLPVEYTAVLCSNILLRGRWSPVRPAKRADSSSHLHSQRSVSGHVDPGRCVSEAHRFCAH